MKNLIIAFVLLLPSLIFAQSPFDKFEGRDGVTSVVVNKKMFELAGAMKLELKDEDAQKFAKIINKFDNAKVYTTTDRQYSAEMKSAVDTYLKKNTMEPLMTVNKDGRNVYVYVREGKTSSELKELLFFVEGNGKDKDTVLVSVTGTFQL